MIIDVDITTPKRVDKTWGYELWIYNNIEYCGKLLVFTKERNRFSMHYHLIKKESWYVQEGDYVVKGDTILFISEVKDQYFDPEILIRTGGLRRISDFLLWQISYTEIFFLKK